METLTLDQKRAKQKNDLEELKAKQIAEANGNESPDMIPANRSKKGEKIAASESEYVHVSTTNKHYNDTTKENDLEKHVVKIHAREFDRRVKEGAFKLYDDVEVIHDPRTGAPKDYALKPTELKVSAPNDPNVPVNKAQPANLKAAESNEPEQPVQAASNEDISKMPDLNDDADDKKEDAQKDTKLNESKPKANSKAK